MVAKCDLDQESKKKKTIFGVRFKHYFFSDKKYKSAMLKKSQTNEFLKMFAFATFLSVPIKHWQHVVCQFNLSFPFYQSFFSKVFR